VEVGLRLLGGHLGYQTALLVLLLTPEAFVPLRNASAQFHASIEGVTAAGQVLEAVDDPGPRSAAGPGPRPVSGEATAGPPIRLDLRHQSISCHGVVLAYSGRDRPALDGLTLEIAPGEHVVVTGPSGAGKSSLLSLLLRFAEPTAGSIEVAGLGLAPVRLAEIDPGDWRDHVAWVPQQPHLFDDTVAGNIALGRPGAGPADVREAARLAGADGFIRGMADGYQTRVGERGLRLSSGQRQKIALARAFLRDAPLLLLDEPAAHLDPFSASQVQDSIAALAAGRTVIEVTHRRPAGEPGVRLVTLAAGRLAAPPAPTVLR
jgi:ATP-binding cassette subfamily C protein CydD